MPRALLSRGQKNLLPKCYSILTIPLLDSHHGVTRYPRATNGATENEKSRDTDRNDVSRLHSVPGAVSGSETSFRMSHEIVPVQPAPMSHHIDPVENPEAKTAQARRKAMSRDIDPLRLSAPKWGTLRLCLCEAQAGAASAFRSSSRCVSLTTNDN